MNEWTRSSYATDVREILDAWIGAIWNYSQTFNDTTLTNVNYVLYISNFNSTSQYDVFISFAPGEVSPSSNAVGLTTYEWDSFTHEPTPPILINITTYYTTAPDLFIRNVVMHEFGHALGLGHASSQSTTDGPELMYYVSSRNQAAYPSTLDVYGLTVLYKGSYSQTVQLREDIPYVMITSGNLTPPPPIITNFWRDYERYFLLAASVLVMLVALALMRHPRKREPEETARAKPMPT